MHHPALNELIFELQSAFNVDAFWAQTRTTTEFTLLSFAGGQLTLQVEVLLHIVLQLFAFVSQPFDVLYVCG